MTARVLLVRDGDMPPSTVDRALARDYASVEVMDDWERAKTALANEHFDLAVIGGASGGVAAVSFVRALRRNPDLETLSVVLAPHMLTPTAAIAAYAAGGDAVIGPYPDTVLLGARLRYLLRQKRLFDEFRRRQHTGSTLGLAPPIPIEAVPLPRRLLVLTDSGDLDQPLRWALTDSGFAVSTEVARPLAAVSPPGRGPELVLIDVSERNSLSIAARYRRIDPGLPIALAHEVRDPFRAVRALDLGIAEPLPRPLDAGATAAALTRMAERHALGERLRRQYRRSLELAMIDSLTGVFNRRYLDSYFKCNGAQAPRGPFALLMIDVDHFKDINDRFGHSGGDSALCQIARRLADNVRASDMVVRAGGEEFVVLMPGADNAAARTVAERLRMVVAEKPLVVQGNEIVATVSIGIAEGALAPTPAALLADADAALYAAKRSGRNCITAAGESADASHSPAA